MILISNYYITLGETAVKFHLSSDYSYFDYRNSALAGIPDLEICKLQSIQNAVIPITCTNFDQITSVLMDLHWLPVCHQILFKVLVLMYKAMHNLARPPQCEVPSTSHTPVISLCSSNKLSPSVPRF